MKSPFGLLALLALSFTTSGQATGVFTVSGSEIQLNGQDFEVKGICYQPTPIGESGGLPPYGDYYTDNARNAAIWARDFPNFRALGANVARLYGWTPGADHSAFLAAAYNAGVEPIYVLINRYINPQTDWNDEDAVNALKAEWTSIAAELADSPAVMGFLIGNEVNPHYNEIIGEVNGNASIFWEVMEEIAVIVKAAAPDKLVSVAITDSPSQVTIAEPLTPAFDFWALQIYRGTSFGNLFGDYASRSTKPLLITEFGYDALDGRTDLEWANPAIPADAVENLLNELRADELANDIAAGACVFEYADEWWKYQKTGNSLTAHEVDFSWETGAFADGEANEEWWGIFRVTEDGANPDILTPRALFYRLAAMWNAPFAPVLQSIAVGDDIEVSFGYPTFLREQQFQFELSADLETWTSVANNASSLYLSAFDDAVTVSSVAGANSVEVSISLSDPFAIADPELLTNGGFENGTTSGWNLSSAAMNVVSFPTSGGSSYAVEIAAPGGYTIPSAFQTVSAAPGEEFIFSGSLYAANPLPAGTTHGLLKMVFRGAGGTPDLTPTNASIGQIVSGEFPGVESRPLFGATATTATWTPSQVRAVAPAGTTTVSFYLISVDESSNTILYDSLSARRTTTPVSIGNPKVFFRLRNDGR